MRNFETDFDFDSDYFNDVARVVKTQSYRIDKYEAVRHVPNRDFDTEHQTRIASHIKRVQREMSELGITKGGRGATGEVPLPLTNGIVLGVLFNASLLFVAVITT